MIAKEFGSLEHLSFSPTSAQVSNLLKNGALVSILVSILIWVLRFGMKLDLSFDLDFGFDLDLGFAM